MRAAVVVTLAAVLLFNFPTAVYSYGNGSPGCMDPSVPLMGDGSKGTGGFALAAFHPDGAKSQSVQYGKRLKLKLSNSRGPYTGFLIHAVSGAPGMLFKMMCQLHSYNAVNTGKKYENVQGRFIQLDTDYHRYPNKGCEGKPEGGVTQRSQRVKKARDSDSFTWVADLSDDKVTNVTFYAIGVTDETWFGLDETPIMLSLPVDMSAGIKSNNTGDPNATRTDGPRVSGILDSGANKGGEGFMLMITWLAMLIVGALIHPRNDMFA